MTQIHTCLNCSAEIRTGPFCERCGQRNVHGRLDLGDLFDDVKIQLLEWDLPWLRTITAGLLRPGKLCREYVDGKRKRYVNPLKYLFYLMTVILILLAVLPDRFGLSPQRFMDPFDANPDIGGNIERLLALAALLAPLMALVFRLLYSRSKYNTTEISCFLLYGLGNGVLIATLSNVVIELGAGWLFDLSVYDYAYRDLLVAKPGIIFGAVILHTIYAAVTYFDEAWYFSWLKVLVAFTLYGVAVGVAYIPYALWQDRRSSSGDAAPEQSELLVRGTTWLNLDTYWLVNLEAPAYGDDPKLSSNYLYGEFLLGTGRARDALYYLLQAQIEQTTNQQRRDYIAFLLAIAYAQTGQPEFARSQIEAQRSSTLGAGFKQELHFLELHVALMSGDKAAALRIVEEPARGADFDRRLAGLWRNGEAEAALTELKLAAGSAPSDDFALAASARWAAVFGYPQQAWRSIEVMSQKSMIWRAVWMPHFRAMRGLPEFKAYVREQGLEDYWRTTGNWADGCRALGDEDFECL